MLDLPLFTVYDAAIRNGSFSIPLLGYPEGLCLDSMTVFAGLHGTRTYNWLVHSFLLINFPIVGLSPFELHSYQLNVCKHFAGRLPPFYPEKLHLLVGFYHGSPMVPLR